MKTKAILESNAMQDNELAANGGDIGNTGIDDQSVRKLLNDAFDEGYDEAMLDADLAEEQKASENPFGTEQTHTIEVDEDAERENVEPPEQQESYIDQLAKYYRVMAQEFKLRFHDNPEDGEKLAQFLVTKILSKPKSTNGQKWIDYINNKAQNGKSKSIIQTKIIPTLAAAAKIEVPRQVNDEKNDSIEDRNGQKVGAIIIPEGFNQTPISLGDTVVTIDFGFPAINFNSVLVKEILAEDDKARLKKLLKAMIDRINGTPAAKALLKFGWFNTRSKLYKVIKMAATAKGIPMLRRPLKVTCDELIGESEKNSIEVIPINQIAKNESQTESINGDNDPLLEGWISENVLGKTDSTSAKMFGKPTTLPAVYLRQFYTVLTPSGTTGLHKYARFMTDDDNVQMAEKLGDKATEAIKTANRNVKDKLLQEYINKTNGVPPFYILIPRSNPKERLRVCDETKINGQVCIKSIEGKNKDAYFFPEDRIDSIFEAG